MKTRFARCALLVVMFSACGHTVQSASLLKGSDDPGACAVEDGAFGSFEGGCLQFDGGVVYSARAPAKSDFSGAESFCSLLEEGGFSDWTLPSRTELIRLAGMDKAHKHLDMPIVDFFWTSTSSNVSATVVELTNGEKSVEDKTKFQGAIVCARRPADGDADGIPDSLDQCRKSPAGSKIATSGIRMGCADGDMNLAPGIGCRKDDSRFQTSNGGCQDTQSGLTWSRVMKEGMSWVNVDKFCSSFVETFNGQRMDGWRVPSVSEFRFLGSRAQDVFSDSASVLVWTSNTTTQQHAVGVVAYEQKVTRYTINPASGQATGQLINDALIYYSYPAAGHDTWMGQETKLPVICVK